MSPVRTRLPANGRAVSAAVSRTRPATSAVHVSAIVPSPPAFETAAVSRGTSAIGASTIGWSIPSNSHTGVRTAFASYDSYEVGADPGARRSQPWNFE